MAKGIMIALIRRAILPTAVSMLFPALCSATGSLPTLPASIDSVSGEITSVSATNSDIYFLEQTNTSDTAIYTPSEQYRFRPAQIIVPASLVTLGVVGIYTFDGLKRSVNKSLAGSPTKIDDYLQFAPAAAYIGLGFIPGVKTRSGDWRNRLMAATTAYAIAATLNYTLKYSLREERPDGTGRTSFPSGHSAYAFAGAELLRIEYGPWAGTAGYAAAIATGILRMHNNRHWLNDVVGGAGIGILSARAAYWLLPLERRLFGLDRRRADGTDLAILPTANGLAISLTF